MTPHFINLPFIMYMTRILSPTHSYLFQSCKSTLQILDDIVDMLGTNGQTDGVLLNALICQLLVSQLGVGCCCWMDNQTLTSATFANREKSCRLSMNLWASACPPLISKVNIEAPPFGKYFSYSA